LHEQRDAVGALDDILPDICGKEVIANKAVDYGADFSLCQPIEGEGRHVWPSDPGRLELKPERHDQHHAKTGYSADDAIKQFKARRVSPMCILENHQNRIVARKGYDLRNECIERA